MSASDFVVHPNRDAIGPDRQGHNGRYRVLALREEPMPEDSCRARVMLPNDLAHAADSPDGSATFAGPDWRFVTAVARGFAREYDLPNILPPFGFRARGPGTGGTEPPPTTPS